MSDAPGTAVPPPAPPVVTRDVVVRGTAVAPRERAETVKEYAARNLADTVSRARFGDKVWLSDLIADVCGAGALRCDLEIGGADEDGNLPLGLYEIGGRVLSSIEWTER